MAIGRPPGSKNRTLAEISRDAAIEVAKAKLKALEERKKKEDAAKKAAQKKAAKTGA